VQGSEPGTWGLGLGAWHLHDELGGGAQHQQTRAVGPRAPRPNLYPRQPLQQRQKVCKSLAAARLYREGNGEGFRRQGSGSGFGIWGSEAQV